MIKCSDCRAPLHCDDPVEGDLCLDCLMAAPPPIKRSAKFIGWKLAELLIYIAGFPFFFLGSWSMEASDWCRDRAARNQPFP